jgi:hypothetical protein
MLSDTTIKGEGTILVVGISMEAETLILVQQNLMLLSLLPL